MLTQALSAYIPMTKLAESVITRLETLVAQDNKHAHWIKLEMEEAMASRKRMEDEME
jgi:hypothetical protein